MQFPYTSCNELILSYQKHDDGKGWTVNLHYGDRKYDLGLLQKVLGPWQFSEEQLQQMKDLVAGGKKISIDMTLVGRAAWRAALRW